MNPETVIDEKPAEIIALGGNLCCERVGAHACGPDHGRAFDALAVGQRDA